MLFCLEKSQGDSEEDQLTFTRSQRDPRFEMQLLMQIPQHTGSFLGCHHIWGVLGHDQGRQQDNNTTTWWFKVSQTLRSLSDQRCFPHLRGKGSEM